MLNAENPRVKVFINFVRELATLSKCTDRGVAAIIINAEATQVYSIGINGGPKGGEDCLCVLGGKYSCIHAEANALAKCKTEDMHKVMICTLSPCVTCASLIANNGFDAVFYLEQYKDDKGLEILNRAGIRTISLKVNPFIPPGYTPPPVYQSPTIFPNGIPPVTVTCEVPDTLDTATILTGSSLPFINQALPASAMDGLPVYAKGGVIHDNPVELDPIVSQFLSNGSVNIPLADEFSFKILKDYINVHNIKTQARVDNGNQILKIWRV